MSFATSPLGRHVGRRSHILTVALRAVDADAAEDLRAIDAFEDLAVDADAVEDLRAVDAAEDLLAVDAA